MTLPIDPASRSWNISGAERRTAERGTANIRAVLRYQDKLQVVQGNVCDLSVGGTGFICQQAVTAGAKCTLQFELPPLKQLRVQPVALPVVVVSSMQVVGQPYQFRINLRFVNMPPLVHTHIVAFIQQSLG